MPPLPPPDPSRYPCLSTSCSVEMRREFDALASSYCQVAYVRIAPPRPAGVGVRTIINGLDCRADITGLVGGLQIPMRSTSCIIVSKRVDANGVLANEWSPRVYVPTTPTNESCIVGLNALTCIPDSVNPDDNSVIPGGLAVLLGSTDLTDASGCIGATVTTFSCGPLTYPKIKLSLKLDPATNNILECVQDTRAGVFVKENGCAIRLSKVNRDNLDPTLGMQLKADIVLSLATNNIASCSVDCDVVPGGEAIGSLHVGFKTDSKSMIFSREVHSCSLGRWELDARLRLNPHVSNGLYFDGDADGVTGYYAIPEIAGGGYHVGNAVGAPLTDALSTAPALNLEVCNPSSVRYSMAIVIFRAPIVVMRIKPGADYKVGITGSFDTITVGQYYAQVQNPGTTTNLNLTFAGYTEVILKGMPVSTTFVASMVPTLVNNAPGVPIVSGDCQVGSYSLDAFTYTIGVDGHRVCGNPSVGPVPAVILAA